MILNFVYFHISCLNETAPLLKDKIRALIQRFKTLKGDPHSIALGTAIGIFISFTPTMPLHTVIALGLALLLKASKPAAAIAVWFSNPLTMPILYYGSFKTGAMLFGRQIPFRESFSSIGEIMKLGIDIGIAGVVGGLVLGIVPAVGAYFVCYRIVDVIRRRSAAGGVLP